MDNDQVLKLECYSAAVFLVSVAMLALAFIVLLSNFSAPTDRNAVQTTHVCQNSTVYTLMECPERHLVQVVEYDGVWYNETTLRTMQHFMNNLEPCPYPGACGIRARYISIEAEKVNLSIGETTISDWNRKRVKSTLVDGHRVNVFTHNGTRYCTVNRYAGDTGITTIHGLRQAFIDVVG